MKSPTSDLLERESRLSQLNAALMDARRGTGRLALVSGEAGIGKTSLVERFTRRRDRTVRLFWGASDALFTPRPLGPLHDMAPHMGGKVPELLQAGVPPGPLFSTVLEALRRPAIAVFEDVHWADEASLDLLRYLGRRIDRTSALLVLTYRDDELGPRHPLRTLLGDLGALSATRRIPLAPLSESAVRTLVGEREVDAAALHRQTGGNPFYITEVLANPASQIPATVRDAVLARTTRLSPSGYAVLEAAAVIGPRAEPWLLAAITGAEAASLEENLANGMLLVQGEAVVFRHELARQTILDAISPVRRRVLHRFVLDSLRAAPVVEDELARLAYHAAAVGDREAVLEYAPAAAQRASQAGAHRAAAGLYALALPFIEDLSPVGQAEFLELYARDCNPIDERAVGADLLGRALAIWRDLNEPVRQGMVLAKMANTMIGIGQENQAERCSQEAITILEALPPGDELLHAYRVRATVDLFNHNISEAMAWAEKARELAEGSGNTHELMTTQNILGTAMLVVDVERGCRLLEAGFARAQAAGRLSTAAHAVANLTSALIELHQVRLADQYLEQALAYTREHDLDRQWLYVLGWQALAQLLLGRWGEAEATAEKALRQAPEATTSRILALVTLGTLRARRGDPHPDLPLDEALAQTSPAHGLSRTGLVRVLRAEAAWLAGDFEKIAEEARAVYELARRKRHAWFTGALAFWRWKAGERPEMDDWMAAPYALQIRRDWQAAAAEWERLGCPYEQARALADGGPEAQMAALEIFDRLGARPMAEWVRRRLQQAGVEVLPRGPRPSTRKNPYGLTNRQLEILVLLTEGLTNAEVAARLHISPKTVGHHVSAVLAKLDVASRQEAASLAQQQGLFSA